MCKVIVTKRYLSPCGPLILGTYGNALCLCDWDYAERRRIIDRRLQQIFGADFEEGDNDVLDRAISQLDEYFSGKRRDFDIPMAFAGKGIKAQVWHELLKIPYGVTACYSDIATRIGRIRAVRAVASAIGANPISIFVPCHRVIGKDGSLTGYAGGLPAKLHLLALEKLFATEVGGDLAP